jgi:glucokinase
MKDRWLLIDVAHQGEVRMTSATPDNPSIGHIYRFETASLPTFTDALLRFQRESGEALHGLNAVIAIAGAAVGDAIPITRTRWNISRNGLASMLGRPVTILNEVAAQAWATISSPPMINAIRGAGTPNLKERGRHLLISFEDGIGTAIIDIDESFRATVLEAEGGHCDFAPQNELELSLCRALSPLGDATTFEQVLMVKAGDPAWRILAPLGERERNEFRAHIAGRLVANLMFATGAWQGVMMRGRTLPEFHPGERRSFEAGLCERKSFRRLTNAVRVWRIEQRESVLAGAAAMMVQRHGMAKDAPAHERTPFTSPTSRSAAASGLRSRS